MTITKLFIYIGIVALVILIGAMATRKSKNLFINWIQFFVGGLFIFSGVIKAIDPVGTAIKMEEYFEVFIEYTPFLTGMWHWFAHHALAVSIFMIVLEIYLGVALLLGKFIKSTLGLLIAIIVFFTFLTGFSHFTQKVTDCGCFGDFMKLTPYQSFMKDILLTVLILIVFFGRKKLAELGKGNVGTAIVGLATVASIWFSFYNYNNLPVKDFRAYKIGTNIPDCMTLGPDAKQSIIEITYIYKNKSTGEVKDFVGEWPEDFSQWDFVERKDKIIQKGDEPKCKDFLITDLDGNEVTDDILSTEKLFVITSFNIDRANRKGFERITALAKEAEQNGYTVIGLTGSFLEDMEALRHDLGLPATFYNLDGTPIKTMNRSNPGLMLLDNGNIIGKWHHRNVKSFNKLMGPIYFKQP
ncbi:MAG: hypothetical protein R2753_17130 [Chitinophagales bacterium]